MSLHLTTHGGKLTHFMSLSTSTLTNSFCQRMSKVDGTICSKCYAKVYERMRLSLREHLQRNSERLSRPLLDDELPFLGNLRYFRINSFGELINYDHLNNIVRIAEHNPKVDITLYTKRVDLLVKLPYKPHNLTIIQSSLYINEIDTPCSPVVDKIFTVFDKEHAVDINCGAASCITCLKCYSKDDQTRYINEKIKFGNSQNV